MLIYDGPEICYNIRHFELNGRNLDDPWSCRQSAVHQKYSFIKGFSKWVIVQPPILFGESLKATGHGQTAHPMGLHLRYLAASATNWREYLNCLEQRLTILVSRPRRREVLCMGEFE